MNSLSEHEYEARPGLPQSLPEDERIVWQGVPNWRTLALRTFHVRKVAAYFGVLLAYKIFVALRTGVPMTEVAMSVSFLLVLAIVAVGMLTLFAWMMARTTLYTITTRRVVMRVGVTISMSVNLPFAGLKDGQLKAFDNGDGDITLTLMPEQKVSYVVLWPHCQILSPFDTHPTLRAVPNAAHVAQRFARAIADSSSDVKQQVLAERDTDFGRLVATGD